MTELARVVSDQVSLQCDVCVPPVLTINTPERLRATGWELRRDGAPLDCCPLCMARTSAAKRTKRRDPVPVRPDAARLPNVVIVGATKAGTTSLHQYLALHPEIEASAEKEMRYFQDPDHLDWVGIYQDHFVPGTRYRLESTPFYSKAPCYPGVVDRMVDLVPDVRVIYLVRDPVDRLVAEYTELLQWDATAGTLAEELADPEDPTNALVASSRYAAQLELLLTRIPRERVLVVDLADLGADIIGTLDRIYDFLGLDSPGYPPEVYGLYNTAEEKRALPGWVMALRRGPLVRALRRLPAGPRQRLVQMAWQRTGQAVEKPTLPPDVEPALRAVLKPDVDRLRELTGQDFASWSL